MRPDLKFIPVKTLDHMNRMKEFAQTFDHDIQDYRHEVREIKKGDQTIGYLQMCLVPTAFVAFHPDFCQPRDTLEIIRQYIAWAKIQHQQGWAAVSFGSTIFTPEIMEKLGFYRMNTELYSI